MRNFNQTAYDAWVYSQYEPEERLFVGRKPPKNYKSWQERGPWLDVKTEEQLIAQEEREDDFLRKHGVI